MSHDMGLAWDVLKCPGMSHDMGLAWDVLKCPGMP